MTHPFKFLLSAAAILSLQACQSQSPSTDSQTASGQNVSVDSSTPSDPEPSANEWELVWQDDFDGEKLDRTKWKPEVSCWGGGNNERQCYTDRPENIEVSDGVLKLKAFEGEHTGKKFPEGISSDATETETRPYTSGKVRTRGIADWKYGRFDAHMKLPDGQGTWPAFWMMPADDSYGSWPLSGEIDILEAVNLGAKCDECEGDEGENRTIAALHFGERPPENKHIPTRYKLPGAPNAKNEYHTFSVEWGEGKIDWYVDGENYFTLTADDWYTGAVSKEENPNAPFDKAFYIMLNLAVGGGLSEDNNEMTFDPDSFPAELLVDWVRVYQCSSDPETGRACMKPE